MLKINQLSNASDCIGGLLEWIKNFVVGFSPKSFVIAKKSVNLPDFEFHLVRVYLGFIRQQ